MVNFGEHLAASRVEGFEKHYVEWDQLREAAHDPKINRQIFFSLWKFEFEKVQAFYNLISREAFNKLVHLRSTNPFANYLCDELPGLSKSFNRGYSMDMFKGGLFEAEEKNTNLNNRNGSMLSLYAWHEENDNNKHSTQVLLDGLLEVKSSILPLFQKRRNYCLINIEALRKLAKKCGKYKDMDLSQHMMCELTMSPMASSLLFNFTAKILAAYKTLVKADERPISDSLDGFSNKHTRHKSLSLSPYEWICELVETIPPAIKKSLVSHRGFHCLDDCLDRPLENTLAAYEQAWSAGMKYCECDITLTLDNKLVLCHDYDLNRLARNDVKGENTQAVRPIIELTYDELLAFPLKNGTYAPLLSDVLQSARRAHGEAQLVIEIKPGADGSSVAAHLCYLICMDSELLKRVAAIMSFDLYILHNFVKFFDATMEMTAAARVGGGVSITGPPDIQKYRPKMLFLLKNPDGSDVEHEKVIDWDNQSKQEIRQQITEYAKQGSTTLDGFYFQYHTSMSDENSSTAHFLKDLVHEYVLGVWQDRDDPDSVDVATQLSALGISFINTDLPMNFNAAS